MHHYDLILTLAAGLSVALVLGYATQRLRLSPIVGYLVAGLLVGPHTPGPVVDASIASQLAEVGVILLMFGVGLQFHIEQLLAVRGVAVPGAIAQSAIATALGAYLGHAIGWTWSAGFVFGIALSVASTVVLIRVLSDHNELHTPAGHIAVGWLVVEDLFTVVALVLLPALVGASTGEASPWLSLGLTVIKVGGLVVFAAVVGSRVIPWMLDRIAATRSRELFTLAVLAIALGIAVGAALLFQVSMALGAFIAGMIVGRSEYSLRAASDALPMRDAFAVLFFVSVGMLLDYRAVLDSPALTLAALGIILVAKPLAAFTLVWFMRYPVRVSLTISVALAQIGEFSFILSALGTELGVLNASASHALIAASILSIVLNPLLFRAIEPAAQWIAGQHGLVQWLERGPVNRPSAAGAIAQVPPAHRAVVVGYGPTGRTVTRLLQENAVIPSVIDLNVETIRQLRESRTHAVYGDASRKETLEAAGVSGADILILSSAGMANAPEVMRHARELNPDVRILGRVEYLRDLPPLRAAGADTVYAGEAEVALAFVEDILHRLGATAEQIDRERERAHRDLVSGN